MFMLNVLWGLVDDGIDLAGPRATRNMAGPGATLDTISTAAGPARGPPAVAPGQSRILAVLGRSSTYKNRLY